MDANGGYYPTYDPYRSFGSTSDPESTAASIYGGGSAQSRFDDEFLELGDWMEDDPSTLMADSAGHAQNSPQRDHQVVQLSGSSLQQQYENTVIRESGKKEKIAFKTKSDIEILDDGFKWRKYGKKMVKNSPNPRNYYRCSVEGCPVKKRVERDKEDYKYVITTYEGTHNHEGTSKF